MSARLLAEAVTIVACRRLQSCALGRCSRRPPRIGRRHSCVTADQDRGGRCRRPRWPSPPAASSDGRRDAPAARGAATRRASGEQLKVGLAYDIGGRGDQSFNDSAAAGLDKAKTELGVEVKELDGQSTARPRPPSEERLQQLADAGYNPIIAVGFAYADAVGKVAKEYPDVKFAIVDDAADRGRQRRPTWSSPRSRAPSSSAPPRR